MNSPRIVNIACAMLGTFAVACGAVLTDKAGASFNGFHGAFLFLMFLTAFNVSDIRDRLNDRQ